jgi:hypothetical protein
MLVKMLVIECVSGWDRLGVPATPAVVLVAALDVPHPTSIN